MHQDDRRPPPALPQHRRLPLRLPHLPHLLASATAMEKMVRITPQTQEEGTLFCRCHALLRQPIRDRDMAEASLTSVTQL